MIARAPLTRRSLAAAVLVSAIFTVTLAVNLQVPLYERYADAAGYRHGVVSVTFAAYVAGLIPVLLLLGGLPVRFGNKLGLSMGLAVALLGQALLLLLPTMQALLVTRVLQGISIGLSLASGSAYLAELGISPGNVARASGAAVALGLASGGLLTTLTVGDEFTLTPPSYFAVALATLVCLLATLSLTPGAKTPGARVVRIPLVSRQTLRFGCALFASWSLTGIILASGPLELGLIGSANWSGWLIFLAIAAGLCVQLTGEVHDPQRALQLGYAILALATALLVAGVHQHSLPLLLAAATLSGLSSFGFTYLGGLTGTLRASPHARVRALAGYYLLGYLGFGLPCVGVGFIAERVGLLHSLIGYALTAVAGLLVLRSYAMRDPHVSAS